jgi:hypothetical protein
MVVIFGAADGTLNDEARMMNERRRISLPFSHSSFVIPF